MKQSDERVGLQILNNRVCVCVSLCVCVRVCCLPHGLLKLPLLAVNPSRNPTKPYVAHTNTPTDAHVNRVAHSSLPKLLKYEHPSNLGPCKEHQSDANFHFRTQDLRPPSHSSLFCTSKLSQTSQTPPHLLHGVYARTYHHSPTLKAKLPKVRGRYTPKAAPHSLKVTHLSVSSWFSRY